MIVGYDCLLGLECPTELIDCTWKTYTVNGFKSSTRNFVSELLVLIGPVNDFLNSVESSSVTALELKSMEIKQCMIFQLKEILHSILANGYGKT